MILHVQVSLVRNFSSNWQIWFFGTDLPKKVHRANNKKSEFHFEILHIWKSLGTKFQLKLIILSFWNKFIQKGHSSWKQDKQSKDYKCLIFVWQTLIQLLFLHILKISKISLFWKFWKKNWLCLASWAL